MLDYYELLGIPRNINEEKLNKKLDEILDELEKDDSKRLFDKNLNAIVYNFYYGFKKTLENYGSKTNYDRALLRSKRIFKVFVLNKSALKKIAASFIIAGTITGSIIGYNVYKKNNYTDVYVPSYGMSITQICEHYGISEKDLKIDSLIEKMRDKDAKKAVNINVKNDKAEEIMEKIEKVKTEHEKPANEPVKKEYSFQYRITNIGVTPNKLINMHNILIKSFNFEKDGVMMQYLPNDVLPYGEVFTLYTNDPAAAANMQKRFDEEVFVEPSSFEEYYAKPGERLPDIADKYGISVNVIMGYNSGIYAPREYYIGYVPLDQPLKIPVYEKTKTK